MAGKEISINGLEPNETVIDADLLIIRQNSSSGTRREKKITVVDFKNIILEAGAELSFSTFTFSHVPIFGLPSGNDSIRCSVDWTQIPKQSTSLTLTLPVSNLRFYDSAGNFSTITGAHTISGVSILGNIVDFTITETGIGFTTLTAVPLQTRVSGANFKLTLT